MNRVCNNCGSKNTYLKSGKYPDWYKYNNNYICHNCYSKLINNPKRNPIHMKINNKKRLRFKDRRIILKDNPRTGLCSICHKQGLTHIHHIQYHEHDPLKDTVELCNKCHGKETWKRRIEL